MKHLLLTALLICISMLVRAQTATQTTVDTTVFYMYAELLGVEKVMSTKLNISIDYGQDRKWYEKQTIVDTEKGKAKTFYSMVDAMNFMSESGWELVFIYTTVEGSQMEHHWVLKRACRRDEKGDFIPLTRAEYLNATRN